MSCCELCFASHSWLAPIQICVGALSKHCPQVGLARHKRAEARTKEKEDLMRHNKMVTEVVSGIEVPMVEVTLKILLENKVWIID